MTHNRYILLISIGPVQSFIAQARRTRDLWFGSHLLTELSRAAASELLRRYDAELIFPALRSDEVELLERLKPSNKLLGIVTTDEPRWVALQVRRAVETCWLNYAEQALKILPNLVHLGHWDRQIKDIIEYHAVWSLYTDNDNYLTSLQRAEQLMTARKTLRDFKPNEPGKLFGDLKSSLDPGRENVLLPDRMRELAPFGIGQSETLDAVSVVKRLSNRLYKDEGAGTFTSVCDVAFRSYWDVQPSATRAMRQQHICNYYLSINQLYHDKLKLRAVSDDTVHLDRIESALFYDNRLVDFIREHAKYQDKLDLNAIYTDLSQRLNTLLVHELKTTPPNYYAFLVCDGDRMGRQLRELTTVQEHQQFSRSLSRFSEEVERIIASLGGLLIYSGGDDVAACLPLSRALEGAEALRLAFAHSMRDICSKEHPPTLSVGIAIVHQLERLGEARALAREAEKLAKKKRNELAILLRKRHGGTDYDVSLSFDDDPVRRIQSYQREYCLGYFTAKLPYELRELYHTYNRRLKQWTTPLSIEEQLHLIEAEVIRLVSKKRPSKLTDASFAAWLDRLLKSLQGSNPVEQLGAQANLMIVAVQLTAEGDHYG
ncbi:type III-B CRISPR-associated protein Cas10/Cmr2 [Paenibacillus sp. YYML68]|uniref:type III-B CRISPR-associated protein Cas10/Cmr2 n=1 Tax=Paenibacillus sp. YYML68 TaxID=2909250 RepID=UPI00248F7797|nr:type III-B CRISPR-associated protein Cas10/Cmr2 [Paenibacillus sp. YYML68]